MHISVKTLLRQLWRNKLFTSLNILGLAIGISACWIIYSIVSFEFGYEKPVPDNQHIYRLVTGFIFDEKESYNGGVSAPVYTGIKEQVSNIKRVVPVFGRRPKNVLIPADGNKPVRLIEDLEAVIATDSNYFNMLPYTWLAGNASTALAAPESVVLTEARARTYFEYQNPLDLIGKTLVYNDTLTKTITGIIKDLDYPTEFTSQEFFSLQPQVFPLSSWTNTNGSDKLYLQLNANADTSKVLSQITQLVDKKWKEFSQETKPTYKFTRWFQLLGLRDSHFSTYIQEYNVRKASKPVLYGLIGLAGFLLLLACINYINLTTAQIPQRSKDIGVRKILGSSKRYLVIQLLMETLVTCVLASLLALFFAKMGFWLLRDLIPDNAQSYSSGLPIITFLLTLIIVITAVSGAYPSALIAKVQPLTIMRGRVNWTGKRNSLSPRKVLIILQFVIAQVFITGALIMGSQLSYTLKKDMGFNKEAVVLVNVPWKLMREEVYKDKQFILATELKRDPGISKLALGNEPMSQNYSSSQYQYSDGSANEPIKRQVFRKSVDTAFIRLYDIKLLAGRNIQPSDTTNEFVINETAMHAFGFKSPADALGKIIGQEGQMFPVVGVVKDFHLQNFHSTIDPMALMADKDNYSTLNIKLAGNDPGKWKATLANIETQWNKIYPAGTFSYKFYDETLKAMYEQENRLSALINLATIVAIVISCLGLFGLATLTAFQRTKEIGIRKVLGASVPAMVNMLSGEFVKLIIIALLIASPIAWWAMQKWLQDFAYRIEIKWWMFAITGIAAVVIALITVSYQAIRAAIANPVKSLRTE